MIGLERLVVKHVEAGVADVAALERGNERVFSVGDNSIRLSFRAKSDSELPRHFWPSS